jgi:hypothetical protein
MTDRFIVGLASLLWATAPACGGAVTHSGQSPSPQTNLPDTHSIECLPRQEEKFHARLDAGYTLRELAIWFTAATCRSVVAPRDLLDRSSATALDRVVPAADLDVLLRSLLAGMKLGAVVGSDLVVVFDAKATVLFSPRNLAVPARTR